MLREQQHGLSDTHKQGDQEHLYDPEEVRRIFAKNDTEHEEEDEDDSTSRRTSLSNHALFPMTVSPS